MDVKSWKTGVEFD